jgi:hypothetical protein
MDKVRVPFHGSDGAARRHAVTIALTVAALVAALAAGGFYSVVWVLTHSG